MKEIARATILDYPNHIVLSNKRRATYYKRGDKLLKTIEMGLATNQYSYKTIKGIEYIVDIFGDRIIKNRNKVGLPVTKKINGQDLHRLRMKTYERSKILDTIKSHALPILKDKLGHVKLMDKTYPLKTTIVFFTPLDEISDLDNHKAFYEKVLLDVLKEKIYDKIKEDKVIFIDGIGVLPEDDVTFLNGISYKWFESEKRKLVIVIEEYEYLEHEEERYYYDT